MLGLVPQYETNPNIQDIISSAKCKSVVSAFGPWTCVKQNVPRNNWDFFAVSMFKGQQQRQGLPAFVMLALEHA